MTYCLPRPLQGGPGPPHPPPQPHPPTSTPCPLHTHSIPRFLARHPHPIHINAHPLHHSTLKPTPSHIHRSAAPCTLLRRSPPLLNCTLTWQTRGMQGAFSSSTRNHRDVFLSLCYLTPRDQALDSTSSL